MANTPKIKRKNEPIIFIRLRFFFCAQLIALRPIPYYHEEKRTNKISYGEKMSPNTDLLAFLTVGAFTALWCYFFPHVTIADIREKFKKTLESIGFLQP
jgi:hypothetical protein